MVATMLYTKTAEALEYCVIRAQNIIFNGSISLYERPISATINIPGKTLYTLESPYFSLESAAKAFDKRRPKLRYFIKDAEEEYVGKVVTQPSFWPFRPDLFSIQLEDDFFDGHRIRPNFKKNTASLVIQDGALTTFFEPKEEIRSNCWKRTLYSRNSQGELAGLLFALTLDITHGENVVHGFPAGRMVDGFIERCSEKSNTEEGDIP